MPFLDRYGMMLKGWLPIAPVGVSGWGGPWDFTHKAVGGLLAAIQRGVCNPTVTPILHFSLQWDQIRRECCKLLNQTAQVKLLAMYGEKDAMKDEADDLLKLFKHSEKVQGTSSVTLSLSLSP